MAYKLKTAGASVALALTFAVGVGVGRNFGPIAAPPVPDRAPTPSALSGAALLDSMALDAARVQLETTGSCAEPYQGETPSPPSNVCERAKRALAAEHRGDTR